MYETVFKRGVEIDHSGIPLQWANIKNEVEARVDNVIQIAIFCSPEPRLDAFANRNAGKVYEGSNTKTTATNSRYTHPLKQAAETFSRIFLVRVLVPP